MEVTQRIAIPGDVSVEWDSIADMVHVSVDGVWISDAHYLVRGEDPDADAVVERLLEDILHDVCNALESDGPAADIDSIIQGHLDN